MSGGRTRGRAARAFAVAAAALAVLAGSATAPAGARQVRVVIDPAHSGAVVAPRFVGLSFEALDLPQIARDAERGPLVALLSSLGPGVLRFGGLSVDADAAFSSTGSGPPWARTTIVPADFDRLANLTRRTGWRVLLAVGLGHYDPASAAAEVAAAAQRLGPALAGIEIGNEPNAFWVGKLRSSAWTYQQYRGEIEAYRRAIAKAVPRVAIVGPDMAPGPGYALYDWLPGYARDERPPLLTVHYYPLQNCTPPAPTIAGLLDPALERTRDRGLAALAGLGRRYGLPVRLGETNNVACRGREGVSNTFAAALWAVRHQLAAARAGLTGVNFHTLPECTGYSPLCGPTPEDYAQGRLQAMPEWYALLLFSRLVGGRFAHTAMSAHPPTLSVDALRRAGGRGLDVVAVNTGERPVRLALRSRGRAPLRTAALLPLTAPALDATSGVRLAGAAVDGRGRWRPRRVVHRRAGRDGRVRVVVPAVSAVLVRLRGGH
jgi:hypothetical protein